MSGTAIAFDTANDVMTHVPWLVLTPTSPEIAGIDTFAIDVSSTTMNVAADSAMVPATSCTPDSGAGSAGAATAACGGCAGGSAGGSR